MDIRAVWHGILERLHLLHTIVDIGEELRILEVVSVGPWKKVVHAHTESLYDEQRLVFSIQRFLQKYATYPVKRLHLTVSRISVISHFLPLPDIPQDKLEQVVEWQLSKLLHLSPQDVAIGYQVISRTHFSGSPGWNILAAVMKKSELLQYQEVFQEAHLLPYDLQYLGHLALMSYLPRNSSQAEGVVVWKAHRMIMAIVENGNVVQYQPQLLPENRHLPTELKSVTQFFSEYIKLGGGYLVRIHVKALNKEEEVFFVEGILESINILAEGVGEVESFFKRSRLEETYWDMYSLFSPVIRRYRINFPLLSNMKHRLVWDGMVQWGLALCSLLIAGGVIFSPWMVYTHYQYTLYKKAEEMFVSGESVNDETLQKRIEEVRQLQMLRDYQQEKLRYERLISEAQNIGIESSNLKMVIVALAQALPPDVRLVKLTIQKGKGEIVGEAKTSKGLQDFVKALLQSPYVRGIAIGEVKRMDITSALAFRILFEVSL